MKTDAKKTIFRRFLTGAVFLTAAFPAPAQAQTVNDWGMWNNIMLIKSFGKPYALARAEHRSYNDFASTECWFLMAGGGYKLTDWLQADLTYEYWQIPSVGDLVQHKGVLAVTGALRRDEIEVSIREKYELALNPANSSLSGTLRTRLRGQYHAAGSHLTPYVQAEIFNGFGGTGWIRNLNYVGCEFSLGGHSTIDLFYMFHNYNSHGSWGSTNTLGAGYTFVF